MRGDDEVRRSIDREQQGGSCEQKKKSTEREKNRKMGEKHAKGEKGGKSN